MNRAGRARLGKLAGVREESLVAINDDERLAGSVWRPEYPPRALILMYPGSGPSDRHNDVLFPPIRAALLEIGVAVCSFDKRGVGDSSGSWLDADIHVQAADVAVQLNVAKSAVGRVPTGLFGHSQGGWVVLEAAALTEPDFVITNSGPAVTPREQETYSTRQTLRERGWDDDAVSRGVGAFTAVMDLLRLPFAVGRPQAQALPMVTDLIDAGVFIPVDEHLWSFAAGVMDHDPQPALHALEVPLLAMFGADDNVVPVERSVEVLRTAVRPDLLDVRVIADGDHRIQHSGIQRADDFADGYLNAITGFVAQLC